MEKSERNTITGTAGSPVGNGSTTENRTEDPTTAATMGLKEDPLTRIRVHELGHALVAWLQGNRLKEIVVARNLEKGTAGTAPYEYRTATDVEILKSVYVSMSGAMAEETMFGNYRPYSVENGDFKHIRERCLPDERLQAMRDFLAENDDIKALVEEHGGPVREMLSSENAKRCLVAGLKILENNWRLSGTETAKIFQNTWQGELPEGVLSYEKHSQGSWCEQTKPEVLESLNCMTKLIEDLLDGQIGRWGDDEVWLDDLRHNVLALRFCLGNSPA